MAMRVCLIYITIFMMLGIMLPFLPVWLKASGFNEGQLAVVLALQGGVRVLVMPLVAYQADRLNQRRKVLVYGAVISAVLMIILALVNSWLAIAVLVVLAAAAWAPLMPLLEAATMACSQQGKLDYGHIRLTGSLAFIGGNLTAGASLRYLPETALIYPLVAAHLAMMATMFLLPHGYASSAQGANQPVVWHNAVKLMVAPTFLVFALGAGLIQASHAVYHTFSALHWGELGYSGSLVGSLWGLGVLAEVMLFACSRRAIMTFGPIMLIVIGAMGGMVRWGVTAFDPPLLVLLVMQMLHGLSFGATHLGSIYFIQRYVPENLTATAQSVYGALSGGILMTLAVALSGPAYSAWSAKAYLLMTGLCAGGLIAALYLRHIVSPIKQGQPGA